VSASQTPAVISSIAGSCSVAAALFTGWRTRRVTRDLSAAEVKRKSDFEHRQLLLGASTHALALSQRMATAAFVGSRLTAKLDAAQISAFTTKIDPAVEAFRFAAAQSRPSYPTAVRMILARQIDSCLEACDGVSNIFLLLSMTKAEVEATELIPLIETAAGAAALCHQSLITAIALVDTQ
jgi:hypothetical protein